MTDKRMVRFTDYALMRMHQRDILADEVLSVLSAPGSVHRQRKDGRSEVQRRVRGRMMLLDLQEKRKRAPHHQRHVGLTMDVIIHTDEEADAVYIGLAAPASKKGAVKRTARVDDDIALDFDGKGRLLGIEVLNASQRLKGNHGDVRIDQLVGTKEAAVLLGVRAPNFVRDHADADSFPRPVVTLASGRIWLRSQVEGYARGRVKRRSLRAS